MNTPSTDTPVMELLKQAWEPFKANLGLTLGVPAVLMIVPFLLVGLPACFAAFIIVGAAALGHHSAVTQGPGMLMALMPVIIIGAPLFAVVYNAIRVGWTKILLSLARGESAAFSDLFQAKEWFLNFLVVNVIIGIATAIGGFCLVVPGVFIAVRTSLAPFLVVDQHLGPIEALIRSNELVEGYSWQIALYLLLFFAANMVVGAVPFIGQILPVAVLGYFDLAMAMIYIMRTPNSPVEVQGYPIDGGR
jgi:uncharacterized membrane protein